MAFRSCFFQRTSGLGLVCAVLASARFTPRSKLPAVSWSPRSAFPRRSQPRPEIAVEITPLPPGDPAAGTPRPWRTAGSAREATSESLDPPSSTKIRAPNATSSWQRSACTPLHSALSSLPRQQPGSTAAPATGRLPVPKWTVGAETRCMVTKISSSFSKCNSQHLCSQSAITILRVFNDLHV